MPAATAYPDNSASSHPLSRFVHYINSTHSLSLPLQNYAALHTWSITYPTLFWSSLSTFLNFFPTPPKPVLAPHPDTSLPLLLRYQWFPNARLNYAEIILRHADTQPNRTALVYRPESKSDDVGYRRYITFAELRSQVWRLAAALRASGVRKGDAVAGILANTPDAVIALLATAAVGAVWSCCSPDFGQDAIFSRLSQTNPKVLFYSPVYRYKGKAFSVVEKVRKVAAQLDGLRIVACFPAGCSIDAVAVGNQAWKEVRNGLRHVFLREYVADWDGYEEITMADPVFCMFSSGTTGKPKCIMQGSGVLLNQMKEHVLHHGVDEYSVMLYATSTGWMLFNWIVAALAVGCRLVLYDGAVVVPGDELRVINIANEEGVTHLGSGAAYYMALKGLGDEKRQLLKSNPIGSLQMVMGTGSPSTEEHFRFAREYFGFHVRYVSMSGGTEINGCFALGCPWKPIVAPELQCAGLGMDVRVFDDRATARTNADGELVCCNFVPCMPLYFGNDPGHKKYRMAYFEKFGEKVWSHGDFAVQTENGGFIITGRSDSTLNPGGVRIGTADLYHVVESLEYVEDALVAEGTNGSGSMVVMFVVMAHPYKLDSAKASDIRMELRRRLSPRHVPHAIVQVADIPYTFSGKKCEVPVKKMLLGKQPTNREAVKNPRAFDAIHAAIEKNGLAPRCSRVFTIKSKL
eukprot:GFKZ01008212.1.p1 GENE.GFKZ01008212.1~~GFKZ01008212.1.p1  ORF type:complete len:689 (-),score=66.93 GFKZ01008212.1:202-2268(-)